MDEKYEVVYRAVIKCYGTRSIYDHKTHNIYDEHGEYTIYSRPYSTPGPAKAVVTKARNRVSFVEGWVEVSTGWKVLD